MSAAEWRKNWRDLAACKGHDTRIFFPERGGDYATAKQICAGCPVRQICLEDALDTHELHGIRGGKSERERRRLRGERRRAARLAPIAHGTAAGYKAHRRRGEQPCAGCSQAHSDWQMRYRVRAS